MSSTSQKITKLYYLGNKHDGPASIKSLVSVINIYGADNRSAFDKACEYIFDAGVEYFNNSSSDEQKLKLTKIVEECNINSDTYLESDSYNEFIVSCAMKNKNRCEIVMHILNFIQHHKGEFAMTISGASLVYENNMYDKMFIENNRFKKAVEKILRPKRTTKLTNSSDSLFSVQQKPANEKTSMEISQSSICSLK